MAFGDFTVVRSTVKRVLNSSGVLAEVAINTPAFEFNADGTYKGLLVEPAGTNIILRSQELNNASWTAFRSSVTANHTTSPDGTVNAEKLVQNNGETDAGGVLQTLTISNSTVHTYSAFVKANGFNFCFLRVANTPSDFYAWFDLSTGVVGGTQGSPIGSKIEDYGNGWYRVSITFTSVGTSATCHIYIANSNLSDQTPGADGVKGINAWGAQLETDSVATSYIPTVASTANRTDDSVTLTGASALIGQTEGTVFMEIEARNSASPTNEYAISLTDETFNNFFGIRKRITTGYYGIVMITGGVEVAAITAPSISSGVTKLALGYATNDIIFYQSGLSIGTDTSAGVPACDRMAIGSLFSSNWFNGWIRSVALFPTRLTNAQLAEITTL